MTLYVLFGRNMSGQRDARAFFTTRQKANEYRLAATGDLEIGEVTIDGDVNSGDTVYVAEHYDQPSDEHFFFGVFRTANAAMAQRGDRGLVRSTEIDPVPPTKQEMSGRQFTIRAAGPNRGNIVNNDDHSVIGYYIFTEPTEHAMFDASGRPLGTAQSSAEAKDLIVEAFKARR